MIKSEISQFIATNIEEIMIKSEDVANVIDSHALVNGLMVLSTEKYSLIPVLSNKNKLVGLINMQCIIEACTTEETIDFDLLEDQRIADIKLIQAQMILLSDSIEQLLNKLINSNFVCVVDEENNFLGIVTRRAILIKMNRWIHSI